MKILKFLPLIGISILVYIIYRIGVINLYNTLITANLFYIFWAVIFIFVGALSLTYKWYVILKIQNINIGFLYAIKLYLIGLFYGVITPARTGSIIRASYLKDKTNKSFGETASSIILERLMDLFVLFIFSIIGCIVFSKYISNWLPIIIISFVIFLGISLFLLKKNMNRVFLGFVHKFLIPGKLKEKSKEIYNAFYTNIPPVKKLIYPLVLTFAVWIIVSVHFYFIARAYAIDIPFFYFVLIASISTIVSLIPITIGGLGTREATQIFLFSFLNIPAARVVSVSLLALILANTLVPLAGFLLSLKEKQPDNLI